MTCLSPSQVHFSPALSGWSRSLPAVEHVRDICVCIHQAFLIKQNAALTARLTKLSTVHEGAVYNFTDIPYQEAQQTCSLQITKHIQHIFFRCRLNDWIANIKQSVIRSLVRFISTWSFISPGTHPEECQVLHLLRGLSLWSLKAGCSQLVLVSRSVAR